MKIVINPKYNHLRNFIETFPTHFETEGEILQDERNTIKIIEKDGIIFNVKRFRVPIRLNRFVYTFLRKSKAFRSYYNSMEIRKRGFLSPEPVAYIETFRRGLLYYSYYVSIQALSRKEIREFYHGPVKGNEELIRSFAQYTAQLHKAGIYHQDYSPGNILITEENGDYSFSLVDTNRMEFKDVSPEDGYRNFSRLFGDNELYCFLAREYAKARGQNEDEAEERVLYYKNRFLKKAHRKKRMKSYIRDKRSS